MSLNLAVLAVFFSIRGVKVQSQISEHQHNQDEQEAYLWEKKLLEDSNVGKYRGVSEITRVIISVCDQKLLYSILDHHVKKDTILK